LALQHDDFSTVAIITAKYRNGYRPFHWQLEFPEVFDHRDGFDAFVGNPPFMGGSKLETALGREYRASLVRRIADNRTGVRGSADLSTYFLLRAATLTRLACSYGMIVTNSVGQGDSREVGLQPLINDGNRVYRAIASRPWPGAATVFYAMVWIYRGNWLGSCWVDGKTASHIDASLTAGDSSVAPFRLEANTGIGFEGAKLSGEGFVVSREWAETLISQSPEYRAVLRPYLTGALLNGSPSLRPSEYVITFYGWPLSRKQTDPEYVGPVAEDYPECLGRVLSHVKPGRDALDPSTPWNKKLRQFWWQFGQWRWALDAALQNANEAFVLSRVTPHIIVEPVSKDWVFSDRLTVFVDPSRLLLALLQSSIHQIWAWRFGTTNLSLLSYSPSACFLSLPLPSYGRGADSAVEAVNRLVEVRRNIAIDRNVGLTEVYNCFHRPSDSSSDVLQLRNLQSDLDCAVMQSYGFDIDLFHGFHETKQGIRFTAGTDAREKLLDRLLALNHERYAAEQQRQQPTKKGSKKARAPRANAMPTLF
jgi:hypothetical protein